MERDTKGEVEWKRGCGESTLCCFSRRMWPDPVRIGARFRVTIRA